MGTIITRKQGNKIYYLYHETYREKINKKDYGKVPPCVRIDVASIKN